MNDFKIYIFSLIFSLGISSVNLQVPPADSSKGPGFAGCNCYGELKVACNVTEVPIEYFPDECTSLLYDGFTIKYSNEIVENSPTSLGIEGYLDKLIATGNKVLIYLSHESEQEWALVLGSNSTDCNFVETKANEEMESLNCLFEQHPGIQGVILVNLDINAGSVEFANYSINLKKYLEVMRTHFPDLAIGMNIIAKPAIQFYNNPSIDWLDFKDLDSSFDFYVVNLVGLNECTQEFIATGVYPLTGDYNYTLDKARNYLIEAGIPDNKLHFKYVTYGSMSKPNSLCPSLYPFICSLNSKENNSELCADTQESLYEKGKYASVYGAGFITATIDLDDAEGVCDCGRTFPAFYALLDGYNGVTSPPPCALFDRT